MSDATIVQVLASLLAAPHHTGAPALQRLEAGDFEDWRAQEIYHALVAVGLPQEPNWQAAVLRVHQWLLDHGRYADHTRDEALRDFLMELSQVRGDAHNLTGLIDALLEGRYRDLCQDTFQSLADDAHRLPLDDLDEAIRRGLDTVRALRLRLDTTGDQPGLKAV